MPVETTHANAPVAAYLLAAAVAYLLGSIPTGFLLARARQGAEGSGHRGNRAHAPENTLESFAQAIAAGADAIELDVRLSADGIPVVMHDPTIDRTTDGRGEIRRMSFSEIRSFDAGARFTEDGGKTFPYRGKGHRVPSFDEVLEAFPSIPTLIEIKTVDAALAVRRSIEAHHAEERTLVDSMEGGAMRVFTDSAIAIGAAIVVVLHDTDLIGKVVGKPLPPKPDPLTRVRSWKDSAQLVESARQKLEAEGKRAFIICNHYGTTGLFTFYLPAAKTNVTAKSLVYCMTSDVPENQFYFWPGYRQERQGENAVFIRELLAPRLVQGWISKWLRGEKNLLRQPPRSGRPPPQLSEEFESVTDLGQFNVLYHGRIFHTYQIFECRNLR